MKAFIFKLSFCTLVLVNIFQELESALPFGVFPLLSTGWYYKPGPVESIVLGLIVVKLLAIRLGATLAGVPYHLNDIFDNKKLLSRTSRGRRSTSTHKFGEQLLLENTKNISLSKTEVEVIERILLALRRIDSHDCFIRYICQVHQNHLKGQSNSPVDDTWLNIFRFRPLKSNSVKTIANSKETTIWDIYEVALSPEQKNCNTQYTNCPLPPDDLGIDTILSGLF